LRFVVELLLCRPQGQGEAISDDDSRCISMLITHEREKLCQAVVFFAKNTNKLGKTKLFKLLFFLDFEHFKLTGRSVTGSRYDAWPKGPVPKELSDEFNSFGQDLAACAQVSLVPTWRGPMQKVVPKIAFSPRLFSKRELSLMHDLAARYRDSTADEMIEQTHLENRPWHQVYEVEKRHQQTIPYELALNKQEADAMQRQIRERQEVVNNYKNSTDDGCRHDPI
jgi:uncharacterized phage-associated protein